MSTPAGKRYFKDSHLSWTWDGNKMTVDGPNEESIFTSPDELLGCSDVIEVDECGDRLADIDQAAAINAELLEALKMLMPQQPARGHCDAYDQAMWENAAAVIARASDGGNTPA